MINRNDLNTIAVPEKTRTYVPISTSLIFDTIDTLAYEKGFSVRQEIFDTKMKGQQQKMRFVFDTNSDKFGFEIALINSYNKTISLRCGAGSNATICWNLMTMAPFKIQEKHVSNIQEDLYEFLKSSFDIKDTQIQNAQLLWDNFDYVNLSQRELNELAGSLFFEQKLINSEQAMILRKELDKPSFKYDYNPESLNSLYQHTTFAIQREHPTSYFQTQQGVQSFFVDTYEQITGNKLGLV